MIKPSKKTLTAIIIIFSIIILSYFYLPINRVGISSELIMLGDLNSDNIWNDKDKVILNAVLANPFTYDDLTLLKIDINRNELIDDEDITYLQHIYKFSNPYIAEQEAHSKGDMFPRPREFFKYLPKYEYVQRPLFILKHIITKTSPFSFLQSLLLERRTSPYKNQIISEIYNEAIRFTFAYNIRKNDLTNIELEYVENKIKICNFLFKQNKYYDLLLHLINLSEDAETLTIKTQSDFIQKTLFFRDSLKALLLSDEFKSFEVDKTSYLDIFKIIESHLKSDLNLKLNLDTLPPPRDLSNINNYLERAQWQFFKSKTKKSSYKNLVLYAQYDRRYLRAASKTSPKFKDIQLENHNLPMILLFRKALSISNNKKCAVALLDESIRIPLGWVKTIPKKALPSSIALENFLLPGNKEDGSDKSRHWNVFGGVAIYKSPEESLLLALKREIMDLRNSNYSKEAMREFIRDTIANINGIYYVVSINPNFHPDV